MADKRGRQYQPQELIGAWRLIEYIDSGGQAEVWRASPAKEAATFALKLIHEADLKSDAFERFRREVRTLKRLDDYPGIVPLHDADLDTSPPWLAMRMMDEAPCSAAVCQCPFLA